MNNLTTRKIVLGLLMAFVLAFSVQGIADARTFGTTKTGDLATVSKGQPFTIKFSVGGLKGAEAKQPNTKKASTTDIANADADIPGEHPGVPADPITSNYTLINDTSYVADTTTHYYTTTETTTTTKTDSDGNAVTGDVTVTTHTRNWVTESAAYYFNDEAIGILAEQPTSPAGDLTLRRSGTALPLVGNTQLTAETPTSTTADLYERATDSNRRLSATTITLTGTATVVGTYTITIKYITHNGDMGPGFSLPGTETEVKFTIYIVESTGGTSDNIDEWGFTGLTNGYRVNIYNDVAITTASTTTNIRVRYEIVKGSGYLYVMETDGRKGAVKKTLPASSATAVYLDPRSSTNTVRAVVAGVDAQTGLFIYGEPNVEITGGNPQTGIISQRLEDNLVVRVRDGKNRAISGLPVDFDTDATGAMFIPVPGTTVYVNAAGALVDTIAAGTVTEVATSTSPVAAIDIIVQTDSRGEAETYFQLGSTVGTQNVTVLAGAYRPIDPGMFSFEAIASTGRRARLSILSGNNQRTDNEGDLSEDLVVVVRQDRQLKSGQRVTFSTSKGILTGGTDDLDNDGNADVPAVQTTGKIVYRLTDANGQAQVGYYQSSDLGSDTVAARIEGTNYEDTVTFNINGGGTRATTPPPDDDEDDEEEEEDETLGTLTVTPPSLSGAPGEVVQLSVGPSTATITVVGDVAFILGGGLVSGTATARNVTLPDTAASYNLTVSATGYENVIVPVTVGTGTGTGTDTQPGTLSITLAGARSGNQQGIQVTAQPAPSSALVVTLSGVINPPTLTIDAGQSSATRIATLPTTTAAHTVTASATGYTSDSVAVPASGSQPPQQQPQAVGQASSIRIASEPFPSGTANTQLAQPLRVQVLDANNNGVANVRVIFRVVSGQGRLSPRGNGRAVAVQTNVSGEARAIYTPLSASSTVRATAAGVSQTVTFTISAGSAPPSTEPRDTGTDVTPSREISPVVQVNASQRPPMLWVDGGAIYALVGASVQKFASGVDNALNIAVGGGKVYWTEKTGESAGTINSANLNGSNVQELASILAVPMGIAVGSDKLYWTNSRGRIQSANLDGSGITNVIPGGLEGVMDLALAGGNAYWTQGGNVRFVNLTGQKQIRNISTGTDTTNSLAIGGGKVYWTEMTGESAGTVNSANLNGDPGATELASILAVPSGIAVDGSRSKLYWTNSRGRVQSANLNGSKIQNVVNGLGNPGDMVLSNSITAPTTTSTTTTTASNKYDVNGDGSVDSKDVDALIVAVAAGVTDAKYDVNGDGKVDIFDVSAVSTNRDNGAAAAPALLGTKLSIVQIDRLQEQIDLLIASNDRSPDAMRILTYLQQLIVMARPEKTQLLANYPNPFNPETWIPYELATDTTVKITIYNTQGVVIQTLELGHQSAGYYTGRDRAAYWDGRNALGEQVASGIYFYQFETDDMSSMRKMVILK